LFELLDKLNDVHVFRQSRIFLPRQARIDFPPADGYIVMMKHPLPTEKAVRIIENFDRLPADQRVEIFRDLSPIGREELVEVIARPTELIRRISEEEMFFTIKQLAKPALALIAMTTENNSCICWTRSVEKRDA
jgi:hypothetical protein